MKKQKIIIFVGPSGVGKGTLEEILFNDPDLNLGFSVSATTRPKRENEEHGKHYFFISKDEFKKGIESDKFIEFNFHLDQYYGTLWSEIDRLFSEDKTPFLEIETEGVKYIWEHAKSNPRWQYEYITFFIKPPSIDELKKRIINRSTEDEASLQKRLNKAINEINEAHKYKYQIVNDDVNQAASKIKEIILNELEG